MERILSTTFLPDDDQMYKLAVSVMLGHCVHFARLALANAVSTAENKAGNASEWSEKLKWNISKDLSEYDEFEVGCAGNEPEVECDLTVSRFANDDFTFSRATFTVSRRKGEEVVTIECKSMDEMHYALNRLAKEIVTFCKSAKPSGKKWRTWLVTFITSMLAIQSAGITTKPAVSGEQVPEFSTAELMGWNLPNLG